MHVDGVILWKCLVVKLEVRDESFYHKNRNKNKEIHVMQQNYSQGIGSDHTSGE